MYNNIQYKRACYEMTWSSIDCVTCIYIYTDMHFSNVSFLCFSRKAVFFHHMYNYVLTASAFPTSAWNFWNGVFPDHNWLTNFQTGQTTFRKKDVFTTFAVSNSSRNFAHMKVPGMPSYFWAIIKILTGMGIQALRGVFLFKTPKHA